MNTNVSIHLRSRTEFTVSDSKHNTWVNFRDPEGHMRTDVALFFYDADAARNLIAALNVALERMEAAA